MVAVVCAEHEHEQQPQMKHQGTAQQQQGEQAARQLEGQEAQAETGKQVLT